MFLLFSLGCLAYPEESVSLSASPVVKSNASSGTAESLQRNGNKDIENLPVYPYDRLRVVSSNPIVGINVTVREVPPELNQSNQSFF